MFEGIIFDLDGTLVDTEQINWQAWIRALGERGVELTPEDHMRFIGKCSDHIESELMKEHGLDVIPGTIKDRTRHLGSEILESSEITRMPYVHEAIDMLSGLGLRAAVATSSRRPHLDIKLRKAGLESHFLTTVSSDDVERAKPHPDVYLLAAERLGLHPSRCVAFEDTEAGVLAAKAAGMHCIAIRHPSSGQQDLSRADAVVDSLMEAAEWVSEKLNGAGI